MPRIRLAVFNTQPPHLYFGGVERRILEMANAMSDVVQTTVYSGMKNGFREVTRVHGVNVVPCLSTDLFFPLDNWTFNVIISGSVGVINADVYEGHAVSAYGFLRALRKRGLTSRFVQTIHGVLADEYMQSYLSKSMNPRVRLANIFMWKLSLFEKELAMNSGVIVTVSQYSVKKIIEYYGVDKSRIKVVPNGVDCQKFRPRSDVGELKNRLGLADSRMVLFVGRLIPRKGLSYLIEAARSVVKEYDNVKFVIAGDGPMRDTLVESLRQLGILDKFVFLGDVSESLLPQLYNCADVFVLPSVQEGQGIALLEAQSSGKPIVAFDVGAVGESVIQGETGFLSIPDSCKLSDSLLRLLVDEPLRTKMGSKGRDFVCNNFSWKYCADKMMQVYSDFSK